MTLPVRLMNLIMATIAFFFMMPCVAICQQKISSYHLLQGESIRNMLRLSNGRLLVLTETGGVFTMMTSETEVLAKPFEIPKEFNPRHNRFLQESVEGLVWTNNDKEILSYNLETKEVVRYPVRHNPEGIIRHNDSGFLLGYKDGEIGNLEIDRGLYWTLSGHEGKGINIKGAFQDFRKLELGYFAAATDRGVRMLTKKLLIFKVIEIDTLASLSLCQASDSALYVGTKSGKLRQYEWKEHNLHFAHEANIGAPVACITEDDKGRLWLGTSDGIRIYNPRNHYHHKIVTDSGGQMECNRYAAYFDTKAGNVLIGTTNGLHVINLEEYDELYDTLRLYATHVAYFNIDSNRMITFIPGHDSIFQFNLPSRHPELTLAFELSNADNGNTYAYRLSPEDEWIPLHTKNEISLNDLSTGRHDIEVVGYEQDVRASFNKLQFVVVVEGGGQYWIWMCVAIAFFALMVIYSRMNKKKLQNL